MPRGVRVSPPDSPTSAASEHIDALSYGALRALAENPEASPQTLALLSHDPLPEVQAAVAWNPRTPGPALARLADGPLEVQAGVAQNAAAPAQVLERLAAHPAALIRATTATNPRLPLPLLQRLAADADPLVRRHAARNPRAPHSLLQALTHDPDPEVRSTAEDGVGRWEA